MKLFNLTLYTFDSINPILKDGSNHNKLLKIALSVKIYEIY